jgi:RNA polymerase sigma-70 factor, ECF subfamily
MVTRHVIRSASRPRPSRSELSTKAISDFIPGWRRGEPIASAELTPLLKRELRRQLRRFTGAVPWEDEADMSAVIDDTLLRVTNLTGGSWPHRAHLMAAAAPLFRRVLVGRVRSHGGNGSLGPALLDVRNGQLDLLQLDTALSLLAQHDPDQGRIAELRLFGGLSIAEVADVLSISPSAARSEWDFARAWIYRHVSRRG